MLLNQIYDTFFPSVGSDMIPEHSTEYKSTQLYSSEKNFADIMENMS